MNEKKIYTLYRGSDNIVHKEEYTVVYSNDTYVYYKVPGSKQLQYKDRKFIYNGLSNVPKFISTARYFNIFLYNDPDISGISITDQLNAYQKEEYKDKLVAAYNRLKTYKVEYDGLKKEYQEFCKEHNLEE